MRGQKRSSGFRDPLSIVHTLHLLHANLVLEGGVHILFSELKTTVKSIAHVRSMSSSDNNLSNHSLNIFRHIISKPPCHLQESIRFCTVSYDQRTKSSCTQYNALILTKTFPRPRHMESRCWQVLVYFCKNHIVKHSAFTCQRCASSAYTMLFLHSDE